MAEIIEIDNARLRRALEAYGEAVEKCADDLKRFTDLDLARYIDVPVVGSIVCAELNRRRDERAGIR